MPFCRALLLLVLCACPLPAAGKQRPMTVDDLLAIRSVADVALSPDGSQVAYVVSAANLKDNRYITDLLVQSEQGQAARLSDGKHRHESPRWSPDGKTLAFLSDRDGKMQVWLSPVAGGQARKLTDAPAGVRDFAWAPDGQSIAYVAPDSLPKERPAVVVADRDWIRSHLHVISLQGGKARRLTGGPLDVTAFDWSPDSKTIAYSHRPRPTPADANETDLAIVHVAEGISRTLVQRPGLDSFPKYSPDGKKIAFLSTQGKSAWLEDGFVCVVPAEGGKVETVSPGHDVVFFAVDASVLHWSAQGKGIYLLAESDMTRQLFHIDIEKKNSTPATRGKAVHDRFSFSADRKKFACILESPAHPREVHLGSSADFSVRRLTHLNEALEGIALATPEEYRWKARDGMEIHGLLIKPIGWKTGTRVPVLTYVHGGPALQFAHGFSVYPPGPPQASRYPLQVFAGRGYAIFCPNPRGSTGRGKAFRQANVADWGGKDLQDILAGVDKLVAEGIADPDRLGIMGWSYGGFMTGWAITQTTRFKAASTGAGIYDLPSMYGQTDIPEFMERYWGGTPWEKAELFRSRSALNFIGRVRTPTLIQHGDQDERVGVSQSRQLYAALRRLKVPVELAIYPRQGHNPTEPLSQQDVLSRNLAWFSRWIKSGEREP